MWCVGCQQRRWLQLVIVIIFVQFFILLQRTRSKHESNRVRNENWNRSRFPTILPAIQSIPQQPTIPLPAAISCAVSSRINIQHNRVNELHFFSPMNMKQKIKASAQLRHIKSPEFLFSARPELIFFFQTAALQWFYKRFERHFALHLDSRRSTD